MFKIYIRLDSKNYKQQLAFNVCKKSIEKYNKNIEIVKIDNLITKIDCNRFLVPYLNNYQGWALVCDNNFLWNCDINEIFEKYANDKYAVCCVKHHYNSRKNWSSLMLFNCSHPSTKNLTLENVSTQSSIWLHNMQWTKDEEIGNIDKSYNYLVGYDDDNIIKALNYIDGIPYDSDYENVEYCNKWLEFLSIEEKEKEKEKICIFTVSDLNYFENFHNFAVSYLVNETSKNIVKYTHFFIYKDDDELNLIKEKVKKYNYINIIFVKYDNPKVDIKTFSCHYRFKGFDYLYKEKKYDIIIYSDVDALINKSLKSARFDLIEDMYIFLRCNQDDDIYINMTNLDIRSKNIIIPKTNYGGKTLSGVIVIRANKNGKKLIKLINKIYDDRSSNGNVEWFFDQRILETLFFESKFKIGILDRKYFDLNLNQDKLLFLCKGVTYPTSRNEWKDLIEKNEKKINLV